MIPYSEASTTGRDTIISKSSKQTSMNAISFLLAMFAFLESISLVYGTEPTISLNHLAEDLTVVNLGNFFEGNNSLLIWDYQSAYEDVLESSLRVPEVAVTNSSSLTRCKSWAEYKSQFGGVQHWIGVCDHNRISRIKFNSFMNTVSLIRSVEYPRYRDCTEVAVDFGQDLIAAYCLDITNPQNNFWSLSLFNGSSLEEIKQLRLSDHYSNLTNVQLAFTYGSKEKITVSIILVGNPLVLAVIDFNFNTSSFSDSTRFYTKQNMSEVFQNYDLMELVPSSHFAFGMMLMKNDGSETVEIFQLSMNDITDSVIPLEPSNPPSTMVLSKFRKPLKWDIQIRSAMLTVVTLVYKDSVKVCLASWSSKSVRELTEYSLTGMLLNEVTHLSTFEPPKYDYYTPEIIIVGVDSEKKHITSMFCSPEYQAVEYFDLAGSNGFGKNLTLGTIISQKKGIIVDTYELLLLPTDAKEIMMIQQIGPPQLMVDSNFKNKEADQQLKKRDTLVLVGSDRDSVILTVTTLTGFSPDYFTKVSLPDSIEVFADQDNEITLPKDKLQLNAPYYSVTLNGGGDSGDLTISYVTSLKLKFPRLYMSKLLKALHLGQDFYLLQNQTTFVIIACTQPLQYLRCSLIMRHEMVNERILAAIFHLGNFYMLTAANLVPNLYLRVISMEGEILNKPMTEWKEIYVSQGTLRVIDNKIQVNVIASRPTFDSQSKFSRYENLRYMYSASFSSFKSIPKQLELDDELPGPMCPTLISWGFSQLKILNILSYCEDSGHSLVTLDYKSLSLDNIINRTEILPQKYPVEMCSTGFQMVVFDKNASKITLHGESQNGSIPVLNILNYPFQVYGMQELISFNCVQDESFFFVLAKHQNSTFYLLAYRYDINHHPWDRVHSIQKLNIDNPVEIVAGEVKKREVVVLVFNQSSVEGYKFVIGAPKINLAAGATGNSPKLTIQYSAALPELAIRKGIEQEFTEKKITINYIDQSYLRLDQKLDPAKKGTLDPHHNSEIDVDALLKVDCPLLGMTLQGVSPDIAVVTPRVSEVTEEQTGAKLLGPRILPSNYGVLTEENVMVTWNETNLLFFKDGKLISESKHYRILTVFFAANISQVTLGSPNPVLLIEALRNGSRNLSVFINLITRGREGQVLSDKFYNISISTEAQITRPKGLYSEEASKGVYEGVLRLILSTPDNRLLLTSSLRIDLSKFGIKYVAGKEPELSLANTHDRIKPLFAFERKFGMLELLFIKRTPIILTLHQGSNSMRFSSLEEGGRDFSLADFPIDFLEFSEGSIDCEDTTVPREFMCTVVSMKTTKSWVIRIVMPFEFDPQAKDGVPTISLIKPIDNIRGFQAMRAVTTRDYIAVFNKNLEDYFESPSLSSSGLGSGEAGSRDEYPLAAGSLSQVSQLKRSSSRPSKSSVLSEKSLVTVYSTERGLGATKTGAPVAIVSFSSLKSLAPDSKLITWYFDLAELIDKKTNKVETMLLVLARFNDKSVLAHYRIGRATLKILQPSKLHSKKGKILLQGVDSFVEVSFQDLFKTNWTRIFMIWTFMLLVAVGAWFLGLWLLNTYAPKFLTTPTALPLDPKNGALGEYGSFGDYIETRTMTDQPSIGDIVDDLERSPGKN